jgi:hypothetical protein
MLHIFLIFFFKFIDNQSLKVHQQQLASEISRARIALSGPLRRKCKEISRRVLTRNDFNIRLSND